MKHPVLWTLGLVGLAFVGLVTYLVYENSAEPTASLAVTEQGGILHFNITTHHVNGIIGLRVWSADSLHEEFLTQTKGPTHAYLWDLDLDEYDKNISLDYGEVRGRRDNAHIPPTQNFPKNGANPAPFPPNARIRMAIDPSARS